MKVRPTTTERHQITVVHAGTTAVHRLDLAPAWTVWYTVAAAVGSVGGFVQYSDGTQVRYSDSTAVEYA